MSIQDGHDMYERRHEPARKPSAPVEFDEVAGNSLAYGQALWAARHGDTAARDLLRQVDGAYAALGDSA